MRALTLAAALLVGGCQLAYRPGDAEFARELKRVADGMEWMKKREVTEMQARGAALAQRDRMEATQQRTNEAIDRLTAAITMQRCPVPAPQTNVPVQPLSSGWPFPKPER